MTMNLEEMRYTFYTKDGLLVGARHLRDDDAVYLVDIFEHMSSNSRYQRFHQTADHFHAGRIWHEAEAIAKMDCDKQCGLICFVDLPERKNVPVGAARYVCLGDGRAETAVSIRDDMQGKGIGTELLSLLAEEARHNGIQKLVADVMNDNRGIISVIKKLPYEMTRKPEGSYATLEIHLDRLKKVNDKSLETAVSASY